MMRIEVNQQSMMLNERGNQLDDDDDDGNDGFLEKMFSVFQYGYRYSMCELALLKFPFIMDDCF